MTIKEFMLRVGLKKDGWIRFSSIEFTLASGRKFRYNMTEFPFRSTASEAEIDAVACEVIKAKYRYCQWDREHPKTNQELEIYVAIKEWMLEMVALAQQRQRPAENAS